MNMYKPLHPGVHVKDILIDGAQLSVTDAAEKLGITRTALSRLINCHTGISSEMAVRLSKLLGNSIDFWVNLQAQYNIWEVSQHADQIKVLPLSHAA